MTPPNRRVREAQPPSDGLDVLLEEEGDQPGDAVDPVGASRGSWLRTVAGVVLLAAASLGVAWATRQYVMTTSRFQVRAIDVVGARRRSDADVAREAGISVGVNVFTVDLEAARAKLLTDPWFSDATLARRLPATIVIQVTEREAGAVVALGDTYLASREGEIFKRLEQGDPLDLPVITGLDPQAVTDDREGLERTLRRTMDLAADYERGPLGAKLPLQEVHVSAEGAVTLTVGKHGLTLALGDPPYRRKLDQAARVLAELEKRAAKAEVVMLDNEARPERVVVRMK